jgi:hypothetical protein
MATSNTAVTIPAPVPAAVSARRANAAARKAKAAKTKPAAKSGNVTNFQAWKDSVEQARQVAGYDPTSPIYGQQDVDVLTSVNSVLESISILVDSKGISLDEVKQAVDEIRTKQIGELLKRKVAKQIAGQTYRGRRP